MRKLLAALILAAQPAAAAPLTPADHDRLEGEWRINGEAGAPACGKPDGGWLYGAKLTLEFRLTGGQVNFDTGAEGDGPRTVTRAEKTGNDYVLRFAGDDTPFRLTPVGKDAMKIVSSGAEYYTGKTLRRCLAGEPRAAIHLSRADMTFLATSMLPENPRFVDARGKGGCKAAQYQYLDFDLADPVRPELRRQNSDALGAALYRKKGVTAPMDKDGMGRWIIEGAVKTAAGYDVTVTELIPPNGSRGDKTTLSILRTPSGIFIPAWKRNYLRCTDSD